MNNAMAFIIYQRATYFVVVAMDAYISKQF